ncbi:GSU2403 family nucleotidyltransferase fold protein [Neorhizobium sp. JUb45]|uniref:nucleotidyltransferase family protein n=1 Tax=Neorhizobium sp. JUb45 TaxID=2485113 RepID=UPI0010520223|nr:GSU2403 family nucleotidyltransferase fold protein [Neorhizobium sp. JUb45]TCQ95818.1 hypothetical protein EDF70_12024 [Neorhizobium sp. JUb45]
MREIDIAYRTMFSELAQRSLDAQFEADYPIEGRFVTVPVKGKDYWYFDFPTPEGDKRRYVGPHADPEITARVGRFRDIKEHAKDRRRLVSTLLRSGGMTGPDRFAGDVVETLADGGLFRLRAVLIGTVAFGCYAGILGVRLPNAAMQTGDADFAQDFAISAEVGDSLPPVLDLLQTIDATFRAVPHQADRVKVTAFANASGYRVEFLTGNRGSDDFTGKPSPMPALGGASAENLRFLDFLIRDPIRTVLLHRSGVSVLVPSPERYAVHKLIVASRRRTNDITGRGKQDKDLQQAALLCEALQQTRRSDDLADAYTEAWERGSAWQEAITAGLAMMPDVGKAALGACLGVAPEELGS